MRTEFNTFSIVARCARTGMLGVVLTTHAHAVGSRCPYAMANVGAVATQALTDPRLGPQALALLRNGRSAEDALSQIVARDEYRDFHQVGVVDAHGRCAA